MAQRHSPHGAGRSLAASAAIAALVGLPLLMLAWLVPSARDLERAALTHELLIYPVVCAAGILFYVCWRLSHNVNTGWLAAAVTLLGTQGIGSAGIRIARPNGLSERAGWDLLIVLAVLAVLVAMTSVADGRRLPVDPLVAGLLLGAIATAARVAILDAPPLERSGVALTALAAGVLAGQLLVAALILRLRQSPLWLRAWLAAGAALLGLGHFLISPVPVSDVLNGVAMVTSVLGAASLVHAALALLQSNLQGHGSAVASLHVQVELLEASVRNDRAQLHELGATIAGIAGASDLLRSVPDLPAKQRATLQRAIGAEASRLQRLLDHRPLTEPERCDLVCVLEPVVISHRARGRTINWHHDGVQAWCRPDDVAEVVNILLENAAQHAGTVVDLSNDAKDGSIEIRVTDRGPGVPRHLDRSLFQWGHRGPASDGQGIGLHIAHRLMTEQGGDLRLAPNERRRGATFLAILPAARRQPPDLAATPRPPRPASGAMDVPAAVQGVRES